MGIHQLITKKQFAEIAGVTNAAITKATKAGKLLHRATVGAGLKMRIDPNHPAAKEYLNDRKQKKPKVTEVEDPNLLEPKQKGAAAAKQTKKQVSVYNIDPTEIPNNMRDFAEMTIREVVSKFGTDYRMVDYMRALKEIETIEDKRLKSAKMRGELVHRELITRGVIEPLDSAHRKMLTDGAKTIARRSVAMVEAGKKADELEKFIAEQISSFIKPAKAKIKRTLESVDA